MQRYSSTSPLADPGPSKKFRNFADKVNFCRALLNVQGFISESENNRIQKRIEGWIKEHAKEKK